MKNGHVRPPLADADAPERSRDESIRDLVRIRSIARPNVAERGPTNSTSRNLYRNWMVGSNRVRPLEPRRSCTAALMITASPVGQRRLDQARANRELWVAVCFFVFYVSLAISFLVDAVKQIR